jgi:hypothetical protein
MLDEKLALSFWKTHMLSINPAWSDARQLSVDMLMVTREQYLLGRHEEWMLLQELLKIDLDESHPFHTQVRRVVNELCEQ